MQGLEPFKVTNMTPQAALSVCGFSFLPDVERSLNEQLMAFAMANPDFARHSDSNNLPKNHFADREMATLRKIIEDHLPQEVQLGVDESSQAASTKITLINKINPELIPYFNIALFAKGGLLPVRHKKLLRKGPPVTTNYADVLHRDAANVSVFGMQSNVQQAATSFVNLEAIFKAMEEREEYKHLMTKLCIILPKRREGMWPDLNPVRPKTMAEIKEDQHLAWINKLLLVNELHIFAAPDRYSQESVLQVVDSLPAIEQDRARIGFMALVAEHKVDITLEAGQLLIVSNGESPYTDRVYPTLGRVYHRSTAGIVKVADDAVSREMYASIADFSSPR